MNKTMLDYMITELTALKAIARAEGMEFTAHFIDTTILTIEDEVTCRDSEMPQPGGAIQASPMLRVISGGRG